MVFAHLGKALAILFGDDGAPLAHHEVVRVLPVCKDFLQIGIVETHGAIVVYPTASEGSEPSDVIASFCASNPSKSSRAEFGLCLNWYHVPYVLSGEDLLLRVAARIRT